MSITCEIRVRPNASKNRAGGAAGEPARLIVAVTAPAAEGKANAAVLKVHADAFEVRARDLAIVYGELHRDKRIVITGDDAILQALLDELLGILG